MSCGRGFDSTDTFISKTTRLYQDPHTAQASAPMSNMDKLNTDLQDVTRIMTKNMEDLLWRGDSLDRKLGPSYLYDETPG